MQQQFLFACLLWTILHISLAANSKAASSPCANGGTLYVDKKSIPRCLCVDGFTGPSCNNLDPCSPSPCQNQGTCTIDAGNSSRTACLCQPGFTGNDCADEILPCSSSPCERGVCKNNGHSYHCQCPPGYSGQNCQTYDGFCSRKPCTGSDSSAVCTDSDVGYTCSCSRGDIFGLNCEENALRLPSQGCGDKGDPESYCLCSVNGLPVKVPLERPRPDVGVKTRDFMSGLMGVGLGWLLSIALCALYHFCCYRGAAGGVGVGDRTRRVEPVRPYSATSLESESTNLSEYMHPESKRAVQPAVHAPTSFPTLGGGGTAAGAPPSLLPSPRPANVSASVVSRATLSESPRQTNIYRAGFVDDMAHQVSHRKSVMTYNSAYKDW